MVERETGEARGRRSGMERFQQAADARGRVLRIEGESADPESGRADALLLTFDIGRLLVRVDPASGE